MTDEELSVRDTVYLTGIFLFVLWLLAVAVEYSA